VGERRNHIAAITPGTEDTALGPQPFDG